MRQSASSGALGLYGTSTSGKTTICRELQNLISNLKIDGTDSAFRRLEEHNFEKMLKYINDNKDKFPNLEYVQHIFTALEICNGILNEQVNVNNREVSLEFDLDESTFESMLEEALGAGLLIEKKAIITLRSIAKSYFNQLYIFVHEHMFSLAINNSIQGVPTILDIVPHPERTGQFMVDLFLDQLKKRNHTGSKHIALIHCSIPQLSDRMLERNQHSVINNNLENVRDQPFPFRQYSQLFGAVNNSQNTHLGRLKKEDAKKAIAPFCTNCVEIEKIIEQIGFNDQSDEISIDVKCSFDKMYDSGSQTSKEIAKKISKILEYIPLAKA